MGCESVRLPDGTGAIVCGRTQRRRARCEWCAREHTRLCDWPTSRGGRVTTCDRRLCNFCCYTVPPPAGVVGADSLDYCPTHRMLYAAEQRRIAAESDALAIAGGCPCVTRAGVVAIGDERVHVDVGMPIADVVEHVQLAFRRHLATLDQALELAPVSYRRGAR